MITHNRELSSFDRALAWIRSSPSTRRLECRYDNASLTHPACALLLVAGHFPEKYLMRSATMDEALIAVLDLYYRSYDEG